MWLLVFIMGFATALTFSNALLHSSKTATGAISFDLKSPSISLNNGLKLNYDANVGSFGTLTYGDSAYDILKLDALDLSVDSGNLLSNYYVKLIYDFTNLAGTVSFAQNSYDFGSAKMSTMTSTGTKNEFYTISSSNGNPNSPTTVTKSDTNKFNVLTFLRDFQYINDSVLSESTKKFTIVVIVDLNENCNSSSRSQLSMTGTINTNIMSLKYTTSGACYVSSASNIDSIEIPYKVKLNADGTIAETDMLGTATGEGWTTVTSIAPNAFSGCTELTTIKNNGSITTIGDNAFAGCTKLSSMELDFTKITSIGRNTTTSTNALSDIAFYKALPYASEDTGTVTYEDILFEYKNQSETLALTNYRVIAPYAFKNQTTLKNITVDSTTQCLNDYSFAKCESLTKIDMTNASVANISPNAFDNELPVPVFVKVATTDTTLETKLNNCRQLVVDCSLITNSPLSSLSQTINIFANDKVTSKTLFTTSITKDDNQTKETYTYNEKYLFSTSTDIHLQVVGAGVSSPSWGMDLFTESYVCSYENGNNVMFKTSGDLKNHYCEFNVEYGPKECIDKNGGVVEEYTDFGLRSGYTYNLQLSTQCVYQQCYAPDSKIQLADGTFKLAKDIEYDDLLLAWNFDEGRFAASYPVWITKNMTDTQYYKIEFEDGTFVKLIVAHRIYSADANTFVKSVDVTYSQIGKNIIKVATDVNGNALYNARGEMYHIKSRIRNITKIEEEVQVINIVTAYQLNNYVNGVLCSTGFSNMYDFTETNENLEMKHNQEQMAERQSGTDTMYTLEEFDNSIINKNIFQGWRIAELKGVRAIDKIEYYILQHYRSYCLLPTDANGNRLYALSTSDGYKTTIKEGDTYTLPTPTAVDGKTFKGWYNNADGKYYQAGDSVEIYVGTHFTARWV